MPGDEDIDRLYQLPLAEFTPERNALLKRVPAGADRAAVRALQKPSVPAWAVNQLYWQRRPTFDRLQQAAGRLREAHLQQLSGQRADVAAAETAHRAAMKAALDEIRNLLRAAGEAASPATMTAVGETLQALPDRDDHGRLVRPLKPLGFEALAGLAPGGATIARLADRRAAASSPPQDRGRPVPALKRDAAAAKQAAEAARSAAAARQKNVAEAERELRDAKAAEREARAAHARVEMALARARRERKALEARLDEATAERDRLAVEVDQRRRAAERAAADLSGIEARLEALRR
jgi:hypothetical protein